MPGQGPGTLKYPHAPAGTAASLLLGCQRHSPLMQTRSRVAVASRCALSKSQADFTPSGSTAASTLAAPRQHEAITMSRSTQLDRIATSNPQKRSSKPLRPNVPWPTMRENTEQAYKERIL